MTVYRCACDKPYPQARSVIEAMDACPPCHEIMNVARMEMLVMNPDVLRKYRPNRDKI